MKPIEKQLFIHLSEIHEVGLRQLAYRWGTYEETLEIALKELVQLGYIKQEGDAYLPADDFGDKWINSKRTSLLHDLEADMILPSPTIPSKPPEREEDKTEKPKREDEPEEKKPSQEKLTLAKVGTLLLGFGGIIGLVILLMKIVPSWKPGDIILLVVTVGAIILGVMGFLKSEQVTQILTSLLSGEKKRNDEEEKESESSE